jgi:hypothetical protein
VNAANLLLAERIAYRSTWQTEAAEYAVALFPAGENAFFAERWFQRVRDPSVLRVRHERFTFRRSSTDTVAAPRSGIESRTLVHRYPRQERGTDGQQE